MRLRARSKVMPDLLSLLTSARMRVHGSKHCIRNSAKMQQSEACAGSMHLTGQAQALNLPPRPQQLNVDVMSPTCASVLPAEMNMSLERPARGRAD